MKKNVGILAAAVAVVALAGGLSLNAVRANGTSASTKAEARLQPTSGAAGATGATGATGASGATGATGADNSLASGKAKSEQRTDRTRFSVEVEDLSSTGTHTARITRAGVEIANSPQTFDVDALGFGELELNTQDGAVNVPVVLAGDLVEVMNPDGAVILSATLAPK